MPYLLIVSVGFIRHIPYNINEPSLKESFTISVLISNLLMMLKQFSLKVIPADSDISKHLSIDLGMPVFYLESCIENKIECPLVLKMLFKPEKNMSSMDIKNPAK